MLEKKFILLLLSAFEFRQSKAHSHQNIIWDQKDWIPICVGQQSKQANQTQRKKSLSEEKKLFFCVLFEHIKRTKIVENEKRTIWMQQRKQQ